MVFCFITALNIHKQTKGEHGEWEKKSNFDLVVRVPLMIHVYDTGQRFYFFLLNFLIYVYYMYILRSICINVYMYMY